MQRFDNESQKLTLKFIKIEEDSIELEELELTADQDLQQIWPVLKNLQDQEIEFLLRYSDEVDDLEDMVSERKLPRVFANMSFRLKKDLFKFERLLARRFVVLKDLGADGPSFFSNEALDEMLTKSETHSKFAAHQVQRLDAIHRHYESVKQDRMNTNVYLLALVSTIFLPLNLIVGFFGINTENLFFTGNPMGTKYVLFILLGVFASLIFFLPLIRLLDQWFLGKLFGQSKFYARIATKMEKVAKRLEV
jgi:magnesium transporter